MAGSYTVYGLMSGTSLDGVDIAACIFDPDAGSWQWEIKYSETIPYDEYWRNKLMDAPNLQGEELIHLDRQYGNYLGELANYVIAKSGIRPFLISSHGHTVFHSPGRGFSLQIGCGAQISAATGIPVACDFRSTDIAAGGQGAPLVPLGDKILFPQFDACLNLGGFANISYDIAGRRIAFDICPVNIVLNKYAQLKGLDYDSNGEMGRKGQKIRSLLNELNAVTFYKLSPPKSLSREWLLNEIDPVLHKHQCSLNDTCRTLYDHIAMQIGDVLMQNKLKKVLLTGGGTHNTFLIEQIGRNCSSQLVIPERTIIDFKEALIFAFMGLLRFRGEINCLASVTGASTDTICGAVYLKKESGFSHPLS